MTARPDLPHPRVPVELPAGAARGGWFLLRGRLLRRGGDYDARLYFDLGDGWNPAHCLRIPTSAKGVVDEAVKLPAGVLRLAIDPGRPAECDVGAHRLVRIGAWRRHWWMLRVVVPQLWRQPRAKREAIGLTLTRALADLPGASELARRLRGHAAAPAYGDWVLRFDTLDAADRDAIEREIAGWQSPPDFHVLLVGAGEEALARSRASVDAQLFRGFDCSVVDDAATLATFNATLQRMDGAHWVLLLRAGDVLAPHALYWLARGAREAPQATLVHGDDDRLDAHGRRFAPRFKPQWSWAHARSAPFMGEAVALRAQALARCGGLLPSDLEHGCYEAVLRTMEREGVARRVPGIVLHRQAGERPGHAEWAMAAVRAHLARQGLRAEVLPMGGERWRVRHALPAEPPLVSIIVSTRDALALTRRCVESVRRITRYPRYEILLVDNQSRDDATLAWMRSQQAEGVLRLLHHDHPFNYAAIHNMAARSARGEVLCLLNNDTEAIHADWLDEMVGQLMQPGVDVVGAKLLYPDERVQHAGDLVGVGGVATHAHAWLGRHDPGYCGRALLAQEYSAVTGACLLTRRDRYLALGGLDERNLPVAFNDVDYCLRVREAGGRVVWTPHAELLHHESVSRGADTSPQRRRTARREAAYMRRRWPEALADDPFHHPNLSRERPDFSLSHAPLAVKPWRA